MPRGTPYVSNFTAGELSPLLAGRVDLDRYHNGAAKLENMVPLPWGPATRRPGLRFIAETKVSAELSRLVEFEFSTVQAYMLLAGASYLWFFRDQGRLEVAATDAAITNGTFDAGITDWDDRSSGTGGISHDATNQRLNLDAAGAGNEASAEQDVATTDTGQEHVLRFDVIGAAGDAITFQVGSTSTGSEILAPVELTVGHHSIAFTPSASPFYVQFTCGLAKTVQIDNVALVDGAPLELGSPYAAADLARIKYTQSRDELYLFHPAYPSRKLQRRGDTTWSLIEIDWIDGPYLDENADAAKTLAPSATTGNGITITAAGHAPFTPDDIGRSVTIKHGSTWGWARIVGYTSATVVVADVKRAFGAATAQAAWRLGLYSAANGYPACGTFHEQRLWLAGATMYPDRSDASASGNFETFTPGTNDDDPIAVTISSDQVNAILWLVSHDRLFAGTTGAPFRLGLDQANAPITPSNINDKRQGRQGAADLRPVPVDEAVIFVHKAGRKVRELTYRIDRDRFVAPDLTILAEHVTRTGIVDICYQQEPWSVVWMARADGVLIGMTYQRDENVVACHRHPFPNGAACEAVASIPAAGRDELWTIVRRTIGGVTRRYVELMTPELDGAAPQETAFYVDSGLTLDNTIAATLTPGATTGAGVTFTAGAGVFVAGDVGREIKYRYQEVDADEGVFITARAVIVGYTSATVVTADILIDFPDTSAIAAGAWRMTVTSVSGLDHLEGETVQALVDGATHPDKVVSAGAIALEGAGGATVHVGLGYASKVKTMPLEGGARLGPSRGKQGMISSVGLIFDRSLEALYGRTGDQLFPLPSRTTEDAMDTAIPLFTGTVAVTFPGSHDGERSVVVEQDVPLPLTLVAISALATTHEG